MVFIEIGSVVVSTSSKTTTTRMLSMLAYTTVSRRYMTAVLAGFRVSSRHLQSRSHFQIDTMGCSEFHCLKDQVGIATVEKEH